MLVGGLVADVVPAGILLDAEQNRSRRRRDYLTKM